MTVHDGLTCPCDCHNSPGTPCNIPGGCGLEWSTTAVPGDSVDPYDIRTLDGDQACIFGCTLTGIHNPGCPCTNTCPDHIGHCDGCAGRPAYEASMLCGTCYWRRLHGPLKRIPALIGWLGLNKSVLKATDYDRDRVAASNDAPLPFNAEIVDHIDAYQPALAAWVDKAAPEITPPVPGPKTRDTVALAEWLTVHDGWLSNQPWVKQLTGELQALERTAAKLAPWRPARHHLPMPCLDCEQQSLVLTAGYDWVDCTNPECKKAIGIDRYRSLERAIARVHDGTITP